MADGLKRDDAYFKGMAATRATRSRRMDPEEALQRSCIDFARVSVPHVVVFAVPNGGKRTKAEAGTLKAMGVLAGVYDLCVLLRQGGVGFIELKAPGKGTPSDRRSPEQIQFGIDADLWGAQLGCVDTIEDFERTLRAWLPHERFRTTMLRDGR